MESYRFSGDTQRCSVDKRIGKFSENYMKAEQSNPNSHEKRAETLNRKYCNSSESSESEAIINPNTISPLFSEPSDFMNIITPVESPKSLPENFIFE